ncbi:MULTISPECIES: hypothetical protein [Gordonia]|uniref:hypothetical protein n=1 Tax=Gordonia TaxID=2053 RepID=UPI0030FE7CEE
MGEGKEQLVNRFVVSRFPSCEEIEEADRSTRRRIWITTPVLAVCTLVVLIVSAGEISMGSYVLSPVMISASITSIAGIWMNFFALAGRSEWKSLDASRKVLAGPSFVMPMIRASAYLSMASILCVLTLALMGHPTGELAESPESLVVLAVCAVVLIGFIRVLLVRGRGPIEVVVHDDGVDMRGIGSVTVLEVPSSTSVSVGLDSNSFVTLDRDDGALSRRIKPMGITGKARRFIMFINPPLFGAMPSVVIDGIRDRGRSDAPEEVR